jgi:hypothetical protein
MAPFVNQMTTHFGTAVPGADAIHTITRPGERIGYASIDLPWLGMGEQFSPPRDQKTYFSSDHNEG